MDLQDYARMLRRGWQVVLLTSLLFVGLAALYLAVTPRTYEATTTLFVSARNPQTVSELQQAIDFSTKSVPTYAKIIDSATVLGPVASELEPQQSVDDLIGMITATGQADTTLIDITASGPDPALAATVANATADRARRIIPALEGAATGGGPLVEIQQTRPAIEPVKPVSPDVRKTLALALLVGLATGLAGTIVHQTVDTRIRRAEDVRRLTDVPVLPPIPHPGRTGGGTVTVRDLDDRAAVEAFRMLRTLIPPPAPGDRRSLIFTSLNGGVEGAQIPANLAWSLAQAGRRVLLVDLDLRRPTVGEMFGIEPGTGMADVLAGIVSIADVIRGGGLPGLHVVVAGTPRSDPSDLLTKPAMTSALRWLDQRFDHVVLVAPTMPGSGDAAVIAGVAGRTFVTVVSGRTRGLELSSALCILHEARAGLAGIVLVGARRSGRPPRRLGGGHPHDAPRPPSLPAPSADRPDEPVPVEQSAAAEGRAEQQVEQVRPDEPAERSNGVPARVPSPVPRAAPASHPSQPTPSSRS